MHLIASRRFPLRRAAAAAALALLSGGGQLAAQSPAPRTVVFDLSPFTPDTVSGELIGLSIATGQVIHARLDATFTSADAGPWSISAAFFGFPGSGALGVSSDTEGWAGAGTFTAVIESDALNGTLGIPDSDSFWTWFLGWSGGKPFTLPGGGTGIGPVDGHFDTLKLTLFLAPCPHGDPELPWTDAGGALPGTLGAPVLTASASLCGGELATIALANARPLSLTALVAGFTAIDAPFKGGVLVPKPDVLLAGLPVSAAGSNVLAFAWPASVPSGFAFWLQHWIVDPQGPKGFAASNALAAVTP
ncbi:MAG TPA: hypothetical protein VK824_06080 [Planctomycetota bacterium]|nr:hypothetical protein [Planctomycetota bacterium]